MAAERKGVLLLAGDASLARMVLRDQAGAQVDVGITVHQRRVRRHLVAAHRHHAHRLGAAGDDRLGEPAHDPLGGERDGLQAGRAEAIDGDRGRLHRDAGTKARDAGDVEPLLGLRHGAADDHVADLFGIDAGRTSQRFPYHRRGHVIRSHRTQRSGRRLADRRPRRRDDYCVLHVKSSSSSSRASPTSLACPSNRWLARSISMNSFGSSQLCVKLANRA